jgi:hypothetical protein
MGRKLRLMVAAMAIVVCGLGVVADQAAATSETEPNNHFTQASGPIGPGGSASGAISASGDVDYYYFYVGAVCDVTMVASRSGGSPYLDLYRYDAGYLSYVGELGTGTLTKQMQAGLYYIKYQGGTGSYVCTVAGASVTSTRPADVPLHGQVASLPETLETHWTQATVSPSSGVTYRAEIGSSGDVDYYYFYVSSLSDVTLGANRSVGSPYLDLYCYDAGYLSYVDELGSGTVKRQLPAGLYYIEYKGSTGSYDFTLTGACVTSIRPQDVAVHGQVISLPEALETGFGQARGPLQSGFTYRAGIDTSGDVDYYYFYVRSPGDVALGANRTDGSPYLDLSRYDGRALNYITELGSGTVKRQLPAGLYYIVYQGSMGSYDFTVTGASVGADLTGPTTACKAAVGRKGKAITLSYRISDAPSPRANAVMLIIRNARGGIAKRLLLGSKVTNTWLSVRWTPRLKGSYRYSVTAKDMAGNLQSKVVSAKITVR